MPSRNGQAADLRNLERVPTFVEFHLLKGPETEDHTGSASVTYGCGKNKAAFEAWTKSEEFRAAHIVQAIMRNRTTQSGSIRNSRALRCDRP